MHTKMKMLKKTTAVVSLLAAASFATSSLAQAYDFHIDFNFDDGDSVADFTLGTNLVGEFSGGTANAGAYDIVFGNIASFSYSVAEGFIAEIDKILVHGTATGFGAYNLEFASSAGTFSSGAYIPLTTSVGNTHSFAEPASTSGIVSITPGNPFAIGAPGTFSIDQITVLGTLSAVPETSTMLLGSLGSAFVLFLGFKRRRQATAAA